MQYDYIWVFYLLWIVLETASTCLSSGLEMAGCQCPKADCNLEIAGKNKTGLPNFREKKKWLVIFSRKVDS